MSETYDFFTNNLKMTFNDDNLVLEKTKRELVPVGLRGSKTIPYSSITSVQFKEPGILTVGYIQLVILGEPSVQGDTLKAIENENTTPFAKKDLSAAYHVKALIEKKVKESRNNPSATIIQKTPIEQIKDLKELLDLGAITQEEFDKKKKQLLSL